MTGSVTKQCCETLRCLHPSCGRCRCLTLAAWRPKRHDGGDPDVLHCLMHGQVLMAPQGDHPLNGCTQCMLAVQVSQQCLQPDKAALLARMATRAGQLGTHAPPQEGNHRSKATPLGVMWSAWPSLLPIHSMR